MGIIYCYTNKINQKKYVGQTLNPKQRFSQHKSAAFNPDSKEYNSVLHRAFRKYGYENFTYEILASNLDIEKMNELEKYYINLFNCIVPYGYNVLDGGKNASKPKSEETKYKLMLAHGKLTEEEVIYLRKAYQNHESPTLIYKEKYEGKMHFNSFLNIWCGKKYKSIMPEVFSEEKRHTKLNENIVKQIRKDRENNGLSYDKLAKKYNISKSTIADIIKRRTWKNV